MKIKILISGIILISLFSCKNHPNEISSDYLVGKWSLYEATDAKFTEPIKYEFKKNGKAFMNGNEKGNLTWEITDDKKLKFNNPLSETAFEYEPLIESNSKMTLKIKSGHKIISSSFERGWSE